MYMANIAAAAARKRRSRGGFLRVGGVATGAHTPTHGEQGQDARGGDPEDNRAAMAASGTS